jgi:DNA polymerase elongation subunit (family B)
MIIDIEQEDGRLKISYFKENGETSFKEFVIPKNQMFEWQYVESGSGDKATPGVLSWDGKPVKKKSSRYLNSWRVVEYLESLPEEETRELYQSVRPKTFFLDIEVEVGDEWPKPDTAKFPVTAIAFSCDKKLVVLGWRTLSRDQILSIKKRIEEHLKIEVDFSYLCFPSEYDMLVSFFHKAIKQMPLLTGWNFIGYDWTYLVNRCKRLNIDIKPSSVSGKLTERTNFPLHRLVVDYMEIYKKWDRVIDVKENNTLDFVAQAALGIPKVKYNGTLQELYTNDYESYIFYNAVDTKLVELIDAKLNTLQTFLTLGNITKVESQRAFSPIYMAEIAMCREFLSRGRVMPRGDKNKKTREAYEGAFVVEPKTGLYEWVASFDFASLYPFIMRQWNISPESYLRNIIPGETVDTNNEILCASGAVFQKNPDSAFRTILTNYYNQRKQAKSEYEEIENEIQQL